MSTHPAVISPLSFFPNPVVQVFRYQYRPGSLALMRSIVGSNEGSEGSILPSPCTRTLGMQLEVCGLATD